MFLTRRRMLLFDVDPGNGGGGNGSSDERWKSKAQLAEKDAIEERKKRQELEDRVAVLEKDNKKLSEKLGGYESDEKRTQSLDKAIKALEEKGMKVDREKAEKALKKVGVNDKTIDADALEVAELFSSAAENGKSDEPQPGTVIAGQPLQTAKKDEPVDFNKIIREKAGVAATA